MSFLRNAWYCAGWAEEIGEEFLDRKILGESVLLYRLSNGVAVAIGNRCPHRFAPLSQGKRVGDAVECPYHGLVFNGSGSCIDNPHGDGSIPAAAKVTAYPLVEKHGVVWIWMGDTDAADLSRIPDFSAFDDREGWEVNRGKLSVRAYYEMITDNLLDLSHVRYLHSFLAAKPSPNEVNSREVKEVGDVLYHLNRRSRSAPSPLFDMLWGGQGKTPAECDFWGEMRWSAPANLYLDSGATGVGRPRSEGVSIPSAHLLTPETESTTHYFWALARNCRLGEPELTETLTKGVRTAFELEDEPMIVACYELMGFRNDLMALKPILLAGDAAAVRARRLLAAKILAENPPGPTTAQV